MKNINKKEKAPNTLRKTVVFFTAILFVISSVMTIENVVSIKDNELEVRLGFVEPGGENWWNSSFYYRKLITINHSQVDEHLTNFPILVYRFKDDDLFSHAQADGDDICFVLYSDNSTKLNHEIESYSSGTGWIWVNVTSLSSSIDTKVWMYYGNSICNSQENVAGTWDSNYEAIWHMEESSGNIIDSTNNGNTGSAVGNPTYGTTGQVGDCINFDGNGDGFVAFSSDGDEFDIANLTVETWIDHNTQTSWRCIMWKLVSTTNVGLQFSTNGNDLTNDYGTTGNWHTATATDAILDNTWMYAYVICDDNTDTHKLYINTTLVATDSNAWDPPNDYAGNGTIYIGNYGNYDYSGKIDELRFSSIVRSREWMNTSYHTMNNPSTFLTVGSEEGSNRPPHMPSNPYPAHGSTSVNINVDLSWTGGDPNGDPVTYDVYLGTNSTPPKVANNQTATTYDPGTLDLDKTYYWKIIAWDNQSAFTEGPVWWFSTGANQPPSRPIILSAPTFGRPEIQLDFSTVAMDPEGDQIYYMWDWGDGELSGWLGPFVSGQTAEAHHTWDESEEYEIKVKAKDTNDAESYWSEPIQIIIENNPPDIVITKPLPNMLYFGNQLLFPFFVTVIIGSIDIAVNASDDLSGMDKVEFYIKDVIKGTVTSAPYIWLWGGITFGLKLFDIKVIAYDNAGNHAYDTILVWRFL